MILKVDSVGLCRETFCLECAHESNLSLTLDQVCRDGRLFAALSFGNAVADSGNQTCSQHQR